MTHALAGQAAARANATPWIKELNPYTVRVILPFAETKAFLKEAIKQSAQEELKRRNAKSKSNYAGFVIYNIAPRPWEVLYKTHEEIED